MKNKQFSYVLPGDKIMSKEIKLGKRDDNLTQIVYNNHSIVYCMQKDSAVLNAKSK